MKRGSENQEENGILSTYFSPGSKARDFYPPHPNPGFTQETPMRPSQIQNRYLLPNPPVKRAIPFQNSEWHLQHSPEPSAQHRHTPHPSNGSVQAKNEVNYHHYDRLRSLSPHRSLHRRPPSPPRPQTPQRSQHHDTPGRTTQSHHNRDEREKAPEGPPRTDRPGHDAHKQPLLNGTERRTIPLMRLDSWSPSSKLERTSIKNQSRRASVPLAVSSTLTQSQTHQLTCSNEALQTKDAHHFLQKRPRQSISDDEGSSKKQCLKATLSDGTLYSHSAHVLDPFSSSSRRLSCDSELTPKSDNHLSTLESVNHCPSPPHGRKYCPKQTSMGAKQACIKSMDDNLLILLSPTRKSEAPTRTEVDTMLKLSSKPSPPHKSASVNSQSDRRSPVRTHQAADNKAMDSNRQKAAMKPSTRTPICRKLQRSKKTTIADDIQDLFTPDPTTYVVHKSLKVKLDNNAKEMTDERILSASSSPQTPDRKLCPKMKTETDTSGASNAVLGRDIKISLPTIVLKRVPLPPKYNKTMYECEYVRKDMTPPRRTSASPLRTSAQTEGKYDEDSLDLDLDLNLDLDLEVESSESEDEPLVSLREIMTKTDKPERDKPERGDFTEASSSRHRQHNKHHQTVSSTKADYKNSLDQLLKEFNAVKRAKEAETELLTACQEDLLKIAEYEEAETREESISPEQQQFLQRFSLISNAIRDVPPGHDVFDLEKFGRLFNQNTLELRQCNAVPQSTAQKTLLWSSHAQFKLYITIGLFQEAYSCSPCPFKVTRFLFKMMSVESDKLMSDKILQVLVDIAYSATFQRVKKGDQKFKMWVPSLADITVVLMNMGAPFVSLFPLENLQPPFTEVDLFDNIYIKSGSESPSKRESRNFPEHNLSNMYKYLSCCLSLCPRFYTDSELLLLLTLLCAVSLESRLLLHRREGLYGALYRLLQNIRRWDDMMPKMCQVLSDLTDDHHNMCHLTQLLPHHSRGRKLRQHLSLSMISKQLDGSCLYSPNSVEVQLCDLRPYLPRMKPASLLRSITAAAQRNHSDAEDDHPTLDQQAYYLCYSLLTLVNEATNFQCFPAHQKEQLLLLCSELERHVKCHIREGEKWLYRSKVKDLVARIYTKWQMMLQKTKPLNGKLYDYWQPLQSDVGSSQDVEEIESNQDAKGKDDETDDDEEDAGAKMEDEEDEVIMMELDTKSTEGGCTEEEEEEEEEEKRSTFELDSEGETSTEEYRACEGLEPDRGSPTMESLSPASQEPSTSRE